MPIVPFGTGHSDPFSETLGTEIRRVEVRNAEWEEVYIRFDHVLSRRVRRVFGTQSQLGSQDMPLKV